MHVCPEETTEALNAPVKMPLAYRAVMHANEHFPNPIPEGDRECYAAWLWLLHFDEMAPGARPPIGQAWLAALAPTATIISHAATGEHILVIGSAHFAFMGVQVVNKGNRFTLASHLGIQLRFLYDLDSWVAYPTTVLSPGECPKNACPERSEIVWRQDGPAEALLRRALREAVTLTVPQLSDLLKLLKKPVPAPARKADCLNAVVAAAFPDLSADDRKAIFDAIIARPTDEEQAEADVDEDLREAVQCLAPDELQDFDDYTGAIDRMGRRDRMKRKRQEDAAASPTTFDWGPFHFWKRPPTRVQALAVAIGICEGKYVKVVMLVLVYIRYCMGTQQTIVYIVFVCFMSYELLFMVTIARSIIATSSFEAPHGGWCCRCGPHSRPAEEGRREVSCTRECSMRAATPYEEDVALRRLKGWALSYARCESKGTHQAFMREYPDDQNLFTDEDRV